MKRLICLTFLVLLGTMITTAKGPADKILITAPDGRQLALTERSITDSLSMAALEVFPQSIAKPAVQGSGYELARSFALAGLSRRRYQIFDRVRYYPAGDKGYVFYIGIENGSSEYDGKWFEATAEGVAMMQRVINSMKARNAPR